MPDNQQMPAKPSPSTLSDGAKWTPGPWSAWDRGIGWEVLAGPATDHKPGTPINDEFRSTFTEPDAHLIAAAPELYAALEAIVKGEPGPLLTGEKEMFARMDRRQARMAAARAALAKARGETDAG
jgi:hypothetical protein